MSRIEALPAGVELLGPGDGEILSPPALALVAKLHRELNPLRLELLARRTQRQAELDEGALPAFLTDTAHIRDGDWRVAPTAPDLADRRVEITGPVDRKLMI